MPLSAHDSWMVILQESPDLSEQRQILDLRLCQFADGDAGSCIELVIGIEGRLLSLDSWCFPNRLAVDEELQIIDPYFARARYQNTESQLLRIGMKRQDNGVFGPIVRALDLSLLHV